MLDNLRKLLFRKNNIGESESEIEMEHNSETIQRDIKQITKEINVLVKGDRYYITADNKLTFFRDSDEENGRILDSVSADKSIIFETNEQPRIEIYKDVADSRYGWVNYVFSEVNGIGRDCEYRLYVPKGTIVKEFKMDLE